MSASKYLLSRLNEDEIKKNIEYKKKFILRILGANDFDALKESETDKGFYDVKISKTSDETISIPEFAYNLFRQIQHYKQDNEVANKDKRTTSYKKINIQNVLGHLTRLLTPTIEELQESTNESANESIRNIMKHLFYQSDNLSKKILYNRTKDPRNRNRDLYQINKEDYERLFKYIDPNIDYTQIQENIKQMEKSYLIEYDTMDTNDATELLKCEIKAISADGNYVFLYNNSSGHGLQRKAIIWDLKSNKCVYEDTQISEYITVVKFHESKKMVMYGPIRYEAGVNELYVTFCYINYGENEPEIEYIRLSCQMNIGTTETPINIYIRPSIFYISSNLEYIVGTIIHYLNDPAANPNYWLVSWNIETNTMLNLPFNRFGINYKLHPNAPHLITYTKNLFLSQHSLNIIHLDGLKTKQTIQLKDIMNQNNINSNNINHLSLDISSNGEWILAYIKYQQNPSNTSESVCILLFKYNKNSTTPYYNFKGYTIHDNIYTSPVFSESGNKLMIYKTKPLADPTMFIYNLTTIEDNEIKKESETVFKNAKYFNSYPEWIFTDNILIRIDKDSRNWNDNIISIYTTIEGTSTFNDKPWVVLGLQGGFLSEVNYKVTLSKSKVPCILYISKNAGTNTYRFKSLRINDLEKTLYTGGKRKTKRGLKAKTI